MPDYPPIPKPFIHPTAQVHPSATIGTGTTIWAHANILSGVVIGSNCSIGAGAEIGRDSVIGDNSRIGWTSFFPPNSVIGKDVFIGPNVVCTDDKHPTIHRPWEPPYNAQPPKIGDGASVGAACVILPGITIGVGARVAAGSIVTKDVRDYAAVRGGPARYFDAPEEWDGRKYIDKTEAQAVVRASSL